MYFPTPASLFVPLIVLLLIAFCVGWLISAAIRQKELKKAQDASRMLVFPISYDGEQ